MTEITTLVDMLIGPIVAALLTIMVLSYLIGDNPFFRLATHLFIGVAAGYAGALAARSVLWPGLLQPILQAGQHARGARRGRHRDAVGEAVAETEKGARIGTNPLAAANGAEGIEVGEQASDTARVERLNMVAAVEDRPALRALESVPKRILPVRGGDQQEALRDAVQLGGAGPNAVVGEMLEHLEADRGVDRGGADGQSLSAASDAWQFELSQCGEARVDADNRPVLGEGAEEQTVAASDVRHPYGIARKRPEDDPGSLLEMWIRLVGHPGGRFLEEGRRVAQVFHSGARFNSRSDRSAWESGAF